MARTRSRRSPRSAACSAPDMAPNPARPGARSARPAAEPGAGPRRHPARHGQRQRRSAPPSRTSRSPTATSSTLDDPAARYVSRAALKLIAGLDAGGHRGCRPHLPRSRCLDRRLHPGAAGARRGAGLCRRCRARPDARAAALRTARVTRLEGVQRPRPDRAIRCPDPIDLLVSRRQLRLGPQGARRAARPVPAGRRSRSSCSSRNSRSGATRSARAASSPTRMPSPPPRRASSPSWPARAGRFAPQSPRPSPAATATARRCWWSKNLSRPKSRKRSRKCRNACRPGRR